MGIFKDGYKENLRVNGLKPNTTSGLSLKTHRLCCKAIVLIRKTFGFLIIRADIQSFWAPFCSIPALKHPRLLPGKTLRG